MGVLDGREGRLGVAAQGSLGQREVPEASHLKPTDCRMGGPGEVRNPREGKE